MFKKILTITIIVLAVIAGVITYLRMKAIAPPQNAPVTSYKDATYNIEKIPTTLHNGRAENEATLGSSVKIITQYFGNEVSADLNGDGMKDVAFLITQNSGGTGVFFYVVVAIQTTDGYKGTNAVLLGDRIAPQTTEAGNGELIVNYVDRAPEEPMTTQPSVGVSKYLKIINDELIEIQK